MQKTDAATAAIEDAPPNESNQGSLPANTSTGRRYFAQIPVEMIARNPHNPRKHFDEAALEEMAASIRLDGVLQPIVVRQVDCVDPDDERPCRYLLLIGERRWRGSRRAALAEIPALVFEGTDERTCRRIALIENLQRVDLNPIEEAEALRDLAALGMTQEQISAEVHRSRPVVANMLRLLELPEKTMELVRKGALTMAHGVALLRFKAWPKVVDAIAAFAIEQGARAGELEKGLPYGWNLERKQLVARIDSGDYLRLGLPQKAPDGESWCFVEKQDWGGVQRWAMNPGAYGQWLDAKRKEHEAATAKQRAEAEELAKKAKAAGKPVPKKAAAVLEGKSSGAGGKRGMTEAQKRERRQTIERNRKNRAAIEAAYETAVATLRGIKEVRSEDLAHIADWAVSGRYGAAPLRDAAAKLEIKLPKVLAELAPVDLVRLMVMQRLTTVADEARRFSSSVPADLKPYAKGYEKKLEQAKAAAVVTPELQQQIADALVAGGKPKAVAKQFGVPLPLVRTVSKAAGLEAKPKAAKPAKKTARKK